MEIKSFKLVTGEEIIANVDSKTDEKYLVKMPLTVVLGRTHEGPRLDFARWSMIQDESAVVSLFRHALVCEPVEVIEEVAKTYAEMVTGLVLPTSVLHG